MSSVASLIALVGFVAGASSVQQASEREHAPDRTEQADPERGCGAYCVGIVLGRYFGEVPATDELMRLTKEDGAGRSTLLNIAEALEARGVRATVEQGTTRPATMSIATMAVADRRGDVPTGHFVVIEPLEGDRVVVYSPPFWVRTTTWRAIGATVRGPLLTVAPASDFEVFGRWLILGVAATVMAGVLLRCRHAVPVAAVVGLVVSGCAHRSAEITVEGGPSLDVGRVDPTDPLTIVVWNRSGREARVEGVELSCGCAFLDVQPGHVIPAGRSELRLALRAGEGQRRVVRFALEFENAEGQLAFSIAFEGGRARGLDYAPVRDLGIVRVGQTASVRASVTLGAASRPLADRGFVEGVRWSSTQPDVLRIARACEERMPWQENGELWCEATASPAFPGDHSASLECCIGELQLLLPVRWTAERGPLEIPPIVVLRNVEGRYVARVSLPAMPYVRVTGVSNTPHGVACAIRRSDLGDQLELTATSDWIRESATGWITLTVNTASGEDRQSFIVVAE